MNMTMTRLGTAGRLVTAAILSILSTLAFAAQPQTFTDNLTQNFTITCPYGDLNASTTVSDQGFVFLEPTDPGDAVEDNLERKHDHHQPTQRQNCHRPAALNANSLSKERRLGHDRAEYEHYGARHR